MEQSYLYFRHSGTDINPDPEFYPGASGLVCGLRLETDEETYGDRRYHVTPYDPTSVRWRTRGRHEPGSGDYINRWITDLDMKYKFGYYTLIFNFDHDSGYYSTNVWRVRRIVSRYVGGKMLRVAINQDASRCTIDARVHLHTTSLTSNIAGWSWFTLDVKNKVMTDRRYGLTDQEGKEWFESVLHLYSLYYDNSTFEHPSFVPTSITTHRWYSASGSYEDLSTTWHFDEEMNHYADRVAVCDPTLLNVQVALSAAYVNAVDTLPTLSGMNNIANIVDILSTLKDLIFGSYTSIKSVKTLLTSAWMGYRYAYSTTKADIEEITSYINRLDALLGATSIRSNGVYRDGDWTVRCSFGFDLSGLDALQSHCEKYGLALNAYAMWDMVPYSFVVDWFLGIGDWLEVLESRKLALSIPKNLCWFSIERRWINQYGNHEIYYYRFSGFPDASLADLAYQRKSPQGVTIVKRALDALCLFS